MHLNSSLHTVVKTRRHFVISATALEIWSSISTILPSLCAHTYSNLIGCCCMRVMKHNVMKSWTNKSILPYDPEIKHLSLTTWCYKGNDTHTIIKQRTIKMEAWHKENDAIAMCISHLKSLIHKKAFPTILILSEQQTAAVVPKDLWAHQCCIIALTRKD